MQDPDTNSRQLPLFNNQGKNHSFGVSGLDDLNVVEVLLGLPGYRRPSKDETHSVPWKKGERSYYLEYTANSLHVEWNGRNRTPDDEDRFYISVKTSEDIGLPAQGVEDILVALLKLTAQNEFDTPSVSISRYELLKMMKWDNNGRHYKKLERMLDQLVQLTVKTNAFYNPEKESYFRSTFNILDSADYDDTGDSELRIRWASKIFEIFHYGYMKQLDTEFYYSLGNSTTKRIYRWLDKHLTLHPTIEIDVLRFAHKVLGYGVSYKYPSQVIQKLGPYLDELYDEGFCRWEVESSSSDSGKKFIFNRITLYTSVLYPRRDYVVEALENRGLNKGAEELVDTYGWEQCLRQIEYHDFKADGIKNSGAWLRRAITQNYDLPEKLAEIIRRAKNETAQWCENMYAGLDQEEKEEIGRQVDKRLSNTERRHPATRRRARNHILLSRRKRL